jgi:hypothetical protein
MPAALTPRVRILVVCDGIRASRVEDAVFHVRGARGHVRTDSFPLRRRLRLFLVLSSSRRGRFPGYVKVINDQTARAVFYGQIEPAPMFHEGSDFLPLDLPITLLLMAQLPEEALRRFGERFRPYLQRIGDRGNSEDGTKQD